ncbi:hypothetical protein D5W68_07235 [Salmonella enterica subsp. enterica serovar Minnesota]|nr:hypothetical protein [Salmonella enterica subsp. enterica serovar Minnesota]
MVRSAWQAIGRPFAGAEGTQIRRTRAALFAKEITFRSHGQERPHETRTRNRKALRAGRPAGHAGTDHAIDSWHGSRGTT